MTNKKPEITYKRELVTPAQANVWLMNDNHNNRNQNMSRVRCIADDILADRWDETGDTIKFSPTGLLLDGQHRLAGIVLADRAIFLTIARNVQPEAQRSMDRGQSRTFGNTLVIRGVGHGNRISAITSAIARMINPRSTGALSVGFLDEVLAKHSEDITTVASVAFRRGSLRCSNTAGAVTIALKKNPEKVLEFYRAFQNGSDLGRYSPPFVMREHCMKAGGASRGFRYGDKRRWATTFNCIDKWIRGEEIRSLREAADTVCEEFFAAHGYTQSVFTAVAR